MSHPYIAKPVYAGEFNLPQKQPFKICQFSDPRDRAFWVSQDLTRRYVTPAEIRNKMETAARAAKRRGDSQWTPFKLENTKTAGLCFELRIPEGPLPRTRITKTARHGKPNADGWEWRPAPPNQWIISSDSPFASMSDREIQVVEYLASKLTVTNFEIAWDCGITLGSVAGIITRIHNKLGHEILRDCYGTRTKRSVHAITGDWKRTAKERRENMGLPPAK